VRDDHRYVIVTSEANQPLTCEDAAALCFEQRVI
jgi:hypothetical protein